MTQRPKRPKFEIHLDQESAVDMFFVLDACRWFVPVGILDQPPQATRKCSEWVTGRFKFPRGSEAYVLLPFCRYNHKNAALLQHCGRFSEWRNLVSLLLHAEFVVELLRCFEGAVQGVVSLGTTTQRGDRFRLRNQAQVASKYLPCQDWNMLIPSFNLCLWNLQDIADSGVLGLLLKNLSHEPYKENVSSKVSLFQWRVLEWVFSSSRSSLSARIFIFQNVYYVLKSSLSICHNVSSKTPEAKEEFTKGNAIEVSSPRTATLSTATFEDQVVLFQ